MLEIRLSNDPGASVRAAPIMPRRKSIQPQNARPASREMEHGRTADAACADNDSVKHGTGGWGLAKASACGECLNFKRGLPPLCSTSACASPQPLTPSPYLELYRRLPDF